MGWSYRCGHRHCRKRHTFSKPLENYVRRPKGITKDGLCGKCGKGVLRETKAYLRKKTIQEMCLCCGVPFPHRKGTSLEPTKGIYKGSRFLCSYYQEPKYMSFDEIFKDVDWSDPPRELAIPF